MTDDPHAPLKDPLKDPLVDPPHALMVCMRGVRRACLHVRVCWGGLGYWVGLKKLPPLSSATLSRASSAAAAGGVKVRDDTTPRATPCSTFDTTGAETPPPLPDPHYPTPILAFAAGASVSPEERGASGHRSHASEERGVSRHRSQASGHTAASSKLSKAEVGAGVGEGLGPG